MGRETKIEWTRGTDGSPGSTWNPWQGCTKVSLGCDFCYAETLDKRWGRDFSKLRRSSDATFYAPLSRKWQTPRLVFTCSMSDFFHRQADPWREEAWDIMRRTPHLTYQVLTKRPGLAVAWYKQHGWLPNVWLGTSVESQKYAPRLDVLARVPAPVRFVSAEPLLGPVDLEKWLTPVFDYCDEEIYDCTGCRATGPLRNGECGAVVYPSILSWVIVGAESGPKRRPMEIGWCNLIRDHCQAAGVPLFVKQGSSLWPGQQGQLPDALWGIKEMPHVAAGGTDGHGTVAANG